MTEETAKHIGMWSDIVKTVGFPIVTSGILLLFAHDWYKRSQIREDKQTDSTIATQKQQAEALRDMAEANREMSRVIGEIAASQRTIQELLVRYRTPGAAIP
jgi:hypothetical protein